jgi:Fe-S-cluster containining protein
MTEPVLDCTRCGACCFNPPENVHEAFADYVEVVRSDRLLLRSELLRRYTVEKDGRVHMRLLADHRCSALAGGLGKRVRCTIYHARPAACRRVQAGSALCQRYRRGLGLEPQASEAPAGPRAHRAGQGGPTSAKTRSQ